MQNTSSQDTLTLFQKPVWEAFYTIHLIGQIQQVTSRMISNLEIQQELEKQQRCEIEEQERISKTMPDEQAALDLVSAMIQKRKADEILIAQLKRENAMLREQIRALSQK